jgi:hypothetical protein
MTRDSAPRRRRSRGQGLVEFALVMPLIALLIFGVLDLGRAVYVYNTLAQASRAGNRTAIVNQVGSTVRASAIAASPTLGLTNGNIDICYKDPDTTERDCDEPSTDRCPRAERDIGCLALVVTHTTYQPMTPILNLIFSSFSLSSTSIGAIEYVCPPPGQTTCT